MARMAGLHPDLGGHGWAQGTHGQAVAGRCCRPGRGRARALQGEGVHFEAPQSVIVEQLQWFAEEVMPAFATPATAASGD